MELAFEWDQENRQLLRTPDTKPLEREKQIRYGALTSTLQNGSPVERDTAQYELAELAYGSRGWYQPVRDLPDGLTTPVFVHQANKAVYQQVAEGLRALRSVSNAADRERLMERSHEVSMAVTFNSYVLGVSTVEAYNAGNARSLLWVRSVYQALNPEGDAGKIEMLETLLRTWYSIQSPETEPAARHAQAAQASKNFRWLSGTWRRVWTSP